jgi:hypothetical protein
MSSLEPAAQVWVRGFATRSFAADRGPRATFAANDPNGEHTVTTDESVKGSDSSRMMIAVPITGKQQPKATPYSAYLLISLPILRIMSCGLLLCGS